MQLISSTFLSSHLNQLRSPGIVGTRRHDQSAPRAQLSAPLVEALSAKRVNRQQSRALCELQQEQASASLALQQEQARRQQQAAANALAIQQEQARSQQQAAANALALQQQKAKIQLMRTEAMLKDRSVKLLFPKGLLNVRGVIEWLAEDNIYLYFSGSDPGLGKVWEAILADPAHHELEQCLVLATGKQKQKDKKLHLDISDIYQHASNHVHGKISPALHNQLSTVVNVVEGPLLPKEAQIMVCICAHFGFPYKYHQIKDNLNQP